jgi:hypothetical protein
MLKAMSRIGRNSCFRIHKKTPITSLRPGLGGITAEIWAALPTKLPFPAALPGHLLFGDGFRLGRFQVFDHQTRLILL